MKSFGIAAALAVPALAGSASPVTKVIELINELKVKDHNFQLKCYFDNLDFSYGFFLQNAAFRYVSRRSNTRPWNAKKFYVLLFR